MVPSHKLLPVFGDLEARIDHQVDLEVAAASAVKGARLTWKVCRHPFFGQTVGSWQQVLIVSRPF